MHRVPTRGEAAREQPKATRCRAWFHVGQEERGVDRSQPTRGQETGATPDTLPPDRLSDVCAWQLRFLTARVGRPWGAEG